MAWGDLLVFVSDWHRQDTLRAHPHLAAFAEVVPNSIDFALVPGTRDEQGLVCVHLSRPERGLRPLLEAWPSVRARVPGVKLLVARYRSFHEPRGGEIERFCMEMDERVRATAGAEHLGSLSKPALYDLLTRASLLVYPADFDETSCIAAIESQACGLPVVAVRRGALPETLAPAAADLIDPGPDLAARFADRVVDLLFDPKRRRAMSDAGHLSAPQRFDADRIAARWEEVFLARLANRPRGALRPVASVAEDPGLTERTRKAIAQRLAGCERIAVLGGDWAGARSIDAFADASGFDAVLDLGVLAETGDPPALLRWLGSVGAPNVVHVLPGVEYHAITRWFGDGPDIALTVEAEAEWGIPARRWIVKWRPGEAACLPTDPARARLRRPTPTVSACLIVRDAADTILTTLRSLTGIADEYHIVDTGSVDGTPDIVRAFAATARAAVHLRHLPWPDDFSAARNASIEQAGGDWILWIDADERLLGGERLRRLLQSPVYEAYAVRQHNHIFDHGVTQVEIPFRVFRNRRGYRFYGAVHEHPERALNDVIDPWALAPGVEILHYGYLTEAVRQRKLLKRNLRLLGLDFEKYPGRRLTDVLYLRDCVNLARFDQRAGLPLRDDHRAALTAAVDRYEAEYLRARDRYYRLGRTYYDQALRILGHGQDIVVQVGGPDAERKSHRWRWPEDAVLLAQEAAAEHVRGATGGFA